MIATSIRLRWALTFGSMRKSIGVLISSIILLILCIGALFGGVVVASRFFSEQLHATWQIPSTFNVRQFDSAHVVIQQVAVLDVFQVITVLGGFVFMIAGLLMQLMMIGDGSTLNMTQLALYGLTPLRKQLYIHIAGCTGMAAIMYTIAGIVWYTPLWSFGIPVAIVSVLSVLLSMLLFITVGKMLFNLIMLVINGRRGRNLIFFVVFLLVMIVSQLPNLLVNTGLGDALSFNALYASLPHVSWVPFAAVYALPFDAATGNWLGLCARLVVILAASGLAFWVSVWATEYVQYHGVSQGAQRVSARGLNLGLFARVPDSPAGAVMARSFTYLVKDPRQLMFGIMPLFMLVIFMLQLGEYPEAVWFMLFFVAWIMGITDANHIAMDGQPYIMQLSTGMAGWRDRLGRVLYYGLYATAYLMICAVMTGVVLGVMYGSTALNPEFIAVSVLGSIGLLWTTSGLNAVISTVLMYPAPSIDKPFHTPQGNALRQLMYPLLGGLAQIALLLPTIIAAGIVLLAHIPLFIIGVVALCNGAAVSALGVWLGGILLDARRVAIVKQLKTYAALV